MKNKWGDTVNAYYIASVVKQCDTGRWIDT